MTSFQRQPAIKVAKIAREVAQWDRAITGMSDGGETAGSIVLVPLENTAVTVEDAVITPDTMVITRVSDGFVYEAGTDYLQDQHGFLNVTIPEDTEVEVTYLRSDYAQPGHRIQLNGVTLTQREFLNFVAGVAAVTDNEADGSTDVDLTAFLGIGSYWEPLMTGNPDSELVLDDEGDCIMVMVSGTP